MIDKIGMRIDGKTTVRHIQIDKGEVESACICRQRIMPSHGIKPGANTAEETECDISFLTLRCDFVHDMPVKF